MSRYLSRWHGTVRHDLTASECETMGLHDLLALAGPLDAERWASLRLGYTDPLGPPWLRQTIAAGYGRVSAADVLCFAGAQEGMLAAFHAMLGPADHAIVVTPNYQALEAIPLGICQVSGVPLDAERGWALEIEAVAAAVRPNTRLVAVNFPNNPTGKVLEQERYDALVALCRRHGLWLFSDEVYRLTERNPARPVTQAVDAYERGVSLNVVSKAYGLPGLRVGWVACRDGPLRRRMAKVKHFLSTCSAGPSEVLAQIALRAGPIILERNRAVAASNLDALAAFMRTNRELFGWHVPEGGMAAFPRYLGRDGGEAFVRRMAEQASVLLLPASVFRSELAPTPADHFRIGFGRCDFQAGLDALQAALGGEASDPSAKGARPRPAPSANPTGSDLYAGAG
jgi:aspartate/methionine/tyrosine aminotransferase